MCWNAVPLTAVQSSTIRWRKIQLGRFGIGRSVMLMIVSNAAVVSAGQSGIVSESTRWNVARGCTRLTECARAAALAR